MCGCEKGIVWDGRGGVGERGAVEGEAVGVEMGRVDVWGAEKGKCGGGVDR